MNTSVDVIPSDLVQKGYQLNPDTEVEIAGRDLRPDMVIIRASAYFRGDPDGRETAMNSPEHVLRSCRWFRINMVLPSTSNFIDLIGEFADGSEIEQGTHAKTKWYVKRNSIL